jgi:hypothetical protein
LQLAALWILKLFPIQNKNAYNVVKMVLLRHLIKNPFSL